MNHCHRYYSGFLVKSLRFASLVTVFLFCNHTYSAIVKPGITLVTDNDAIYLGDSVIIEIEAVGILDTLDVSPLFKGADLLRETTGTRIAVINERVVEVKVRRMEFLPKQEGKIYFGPLRADSIRGPVRSNTITVNVLPPVDTQWQPEKHDLQISMTLSSDNNALIDPTKIQPFVGQHLIADIVLQHRHPIADEQLQIPAFGGFDVLPEFEQRRTIDKTSAEDSVRLITWRYHLFAQHSGTLSVDNIQWSGTAIRSRTQRADFTRKTAPLSLTIKPALAGHTWWLPATSVSLTDTWSKDVRKLSAGDEIVRTITLEARDVLANHLPVMEPLESRGISSTLIKQTRTQELSGDHIVAKAVFDFRIVAQSPTAVFLDTVRVRWYNTLSQQNKQAIIPARRINVGLPDRADLLADLALNDDWKSRFLLKLRSSGQTFDSWHLSLVLLVLVTAGLGLSELNRRYHNRNNGGAPRVLPEL